MEPQADNYSDSVSRVPTPPPSYEDAATFVYLPTISAAPPSYESVVIAIASHDPASEPQQEPHFSELRNIVYFVYKSVQDIILLVFVLIF